MTTQATIDTSDGRRFAAVIGAVLFWVFSPVFVKCCSF